MKTDGEMRRAFRARPKRAGLIRPGIESLERRELLASLDPAVVLDSVSTLDSRGVTIEYHVANGDLGQPFELGVYRSADDRFDSSDLTVRTLTIGGPGAPALDDNGVAPLAEGHHRLTLSLPDGLPPTPSHPYVLAVADPSSALSGGAESQNSVAFRTYLIGVLTHGGFQTKSWRDRGAPWALQMAKSLKAQGYDVVIPYNWVAESRTPGAAAKQGPRVARLVELAANQAPEGEPVDVHFIGHSEGTVVNSVAIRYLEKNEPARLAEGYLKVTLLDPHAANNNAPGGRQYSVSKGLLGDLARWIIDGYQQKAKDPLPVIWGNVDAADVYYQRTPIAGAKGSNDGIYNLWGQVPVPVEGDTPVRYYNLTGVGISHTGYVNVVDWYQVHVVPTLGDNSPFTNPGLLNGEPAMGSDVTAASEPVFQGAAAPGTRLSVRARSSAPSPPIVLGSTVADQDGNWSLTSRRLPPGTYQVRAKGVAIADPKWPRVLVIPNARLGTITVDAS
ncbi:lipase family protein [Singulisphaera acidiphila]|uniref:Bacterial Ig-like domain-containing protein n=1 Tax=Singulisphaera acidiphila (strain ATCC BAA-1392 / DSM 18658 / VKM B-2454 / MOB10) TaxID=886293 RepID=L0DNP4_SINAD|nr:hypothetical protein [Singulisphaera acidiphila]AGA30994.1 hypothetical protein Sinac_6938 [Singulisphaera acidiphila DSM 18658]